MRTSIIALVIGVIVGVNLAYTDTIEQHLNELEDYLYSGKHKNKQIYMQSALYSRYQHLTKFDNTTNVSGQEILNLIDENSKNDDSYLDRLTILVQSKDEPGKVNTFGHTLTNVVGLQHSTEEVFLDKPQGAKLPLLNYRDLMKVEAYKGIVNMDNDSNRGGAVGNPELMFSYADEDSFVTTTWFVAKARVTRVLSNLSTDTIDPEGRYLASLIVADDASLVTGIYFEEYGTDLTHAVLAHKLYALNKLPSLNEYWGD